MPKERRMASQLGSIPPTFRIDERRMSGNSRNSLPYKIYGRECMKEREGEEGARYACVCVCVWERGCG